MGKDPDHNVRQRQLSTAVLAGGQSRRMGSNKALVAIDGRPMICHVLDRVASISDDVFVVAKHALDIDARVVLEPTQPQTPLLGVLTALRTARHPLVFICGCDMPLVSPELAAFLAERAEGVDAVVPFWGLSQALHCVWSASAADEVAALLDAGEFALRGALRQLTIAEVDEATWRTVDPDGLAFTNVNTPEDLRAIRSAPSETQRSSDPR